ncbi:MAG: hypothetical protein PHH85_01625 [Candidatus Methanoperedens sp.]|nr:hypothetical protein [Candidatus Methanoperedens sp.]
MVKQQLADDLGISIDGLQYNAGMFIIQKQFVGAVAATATGDFGTAMTASTTTYHVLGRMPKAGQLVEGKIRAHAAGVGATTTLDILKVASGTAVSSGTAMVTQVATNGLTADTDYSLAPKTDGSQNTGAGDLIVAKIVTQGTETLTPPIIDLKFRL